MQGREVFKYASTRMPAAVRLALQTNGLTTQDIALFIPHQANLRISEMVQKQLDLRDDQVFNNIVRYGNTTAASIPIALHEAVEARNIRRGDLVVLAAFGSGFTWGAAAIRW
jgi:3-oxoacyl-[acyl-carrier-protein] synthase-3